MKCLIEYYFYQEFDSLKTFMLSLLQKYYRYIRKYRKTKREKTSIFSGMKFLFKKQNNRIFF